MQPEDQNPERPQTEYRRRDHLNTHRSALTAEARNIWRAWLQIFGLGRLIVRRIFEVILALWLLFEEWGWKPLTAALARLGRLAPFAMIERWIAGLPPYGALIVFALPSALLLPLKLFAIFLIAQGYKTAAALLFIGAKVVGTALVARIYQLTQVALMRIGWFKWLYDRVMPWKDALFVSIRTSWAWRYGRLIKARVKKSLAPMTALARATLNAWRHRLLGR
ncbi:MAG: hypothetical protein ABL898_14695 [Hyphomicrobiaceae bacterium]